MPFPFIITVISHCRDPIQAKITKIGKNYGKNRKKMTLEHYIDISWLSFERLALEVILRRGSCKLIKIPSFGCKVSLWCVLTEKWQRRWIGTPRIYSLFGARLGPLQFRDCKVYWTWRRLRAWILWVNVFGSVTGKTVVAVSDQTNQ